MRGPIPIAPAVVLLAMLALSAAVLPVLPVSAAGPAPPAGTGEPERTGEPAPPARAVESGALTLEALLKRIGGKARQETRFEEKKYLAVLDAPVQSAGVLRFQAPDRLEKNTERPIRESLMLDGALLVVERDGKRRSMPAAQFPGVAALVGGLRDTLGGDAEALRRVFKVVLQGDPQNWQMDLLPLDATSAQLVTRITLRGRGDQLLEVEMLQADGDRSVMTLSPGSLPTPQAR